MAGEVHVTLIGNLTDQPEVRFTSSGRAVASLTVAVTPRYYNRDSGEYKDGDTSFYRCAAWGDFGERVAESFSRGDRVIAVGRQQIREYETTEGEKRRAVEVELDDLAASARFHRVAVQRAARASDEAADQARTARAAAHAATPA